MMISCWECGEQVSDAAINCPKCGAPLRKQEAPPMNYFAPNAQSNPFAAQNAPHAVGANKSKIAAGLFAIFLSLGIYNFYLGHIGKAVIQLVMTIVGWVLFFVSIGMAVSAGVASAYDVYFTTTSLALFFFGLLLPLVVVIWDWVDAIRILGGFKRTDARGNPLV